MRIEEYDVVRTIRMRGATSRMRSAQRRTVSPPGNGRAAPSSWKRLEFSRGVTTAGRFKGRRHAMWSGFTPSADVVGFTNSATDRDVFTRQWKCTVHGFGGPTRRLCPLTARAEGAGALPRTEQRHSRAMALPRFGVETPNKPKRRLRLATNGSKRWSCASENSRHATPNFHSASWSYRLMPHLQLDDSRFAPMDAATAAIASQLSDNLIELDAIAEWLAGVEMQTGQRFDASWSHIGRVRAEAIAIAARNSHRRVARGERPLIGSLKTEPGHVLRPRSGPAGLTTRQPCVLRPHVFASRSRSTDQPSVQKRMLDLSAIRPRI